MRISFAASMLFVALASLPNGAYAQVQSHAFVVDVAKSGALFANPADAVASISDASADKPYLVKIHPGVYELASTPIVGKPYVDIEGSGQGVTILKGTGYPAALLRAASNETVRDLTLRGYTELADGVTLRNVTLDAPTSSCGLKLLAGAVLDHVKVVTRSAAVWIAGGSSKILLDHCSLGGSIYDNGTISVGGSGNEIVIKDTTTYDPVSTISIAPGVSANTIRVNHSQIVSSRFLVYDTSDSAKNNTFVFFDSMVLGAGMPVGAKCLGVYSFTSNTQITCP